MPTLSSALRPARRLEGVAPYTPSKPQLAVDLRLDGNEGLAPPASLLRALEDPEVLRRYPSCRALESALAARWGVAPERVLVTAGADDALDRIARALLERGRTAVVPEPTFQMIPHYVRLSGGELRSVPWSSGAYPLEEVLAAADASTALVTAVSPNNPTGGVIDAAQLRTLAQTLPQALVVLDAAYGEFADADPTPAALELSNVVVTRTLSKAWGLAGLRVGYVLGPPEVIGWLRAVGQPYAVSGPSLALAAAWLEAGRDVLPTVVARVREERAALTRTLRSLGADAQASQGNFVLARFGSRARAQAVWRGLAERGIATRCWPERPALDDALRVSCPCDASSLERLFTALKEVL